MIIIGEKINATLAATKDIILNRNSEGLLDLAKKQAAAGASFIDVNVATGVGSREDEVQAMQWAVEAIQEAVDTPLSIDSADPAVLEAGLEALKTQSGMINSTKAEEASLEDIVPLTAQYGALLVALTMDETGIPKTVEDRLRAGEKIVTACEKYGVPIQKVFFDPLVMPVSTDITYGKVTLNTVSAVKEKFPGARTVLGLSNVSYGLPARSQVNVAFLHMCVYAGLDAAIVDPLDEALMAAIKTAEVLVGKDRHCRRYTRAFRK